VNDREGRGALAVRGVKERESSWYLYVFVQNEQRAFRINSSSTIWPGKKGRDQQKVCCSYQTPGPSKQSPHANTIAGQLLVCLSATPVLMCSLLLFSFLSFLNERTKSSADE
jgi:hypothetical protein